MSSLNKLVISYEPDNLMTEKDFLQSEVKNDYPDYSHFYDSAHSVMWDDFCEELGKRVVNMRGKVEVKTSVVVKSLRIREGKTFPKTTIKVDLPENLDDAVPYMVGLRFLGQLTGEVNSAYVKHVGNYDTKKSFILIIPMQGCDLTFEVKRKR